jgi:diguanylate cyclase (GGDEF)-like protein
MGLLVTIIILKRENQNLKQQLKTAKEDIVNVEKRAQKAEEEAITDYLTGLSNRRYLFNRYYQEVRRAKRYGRPFQVLFIDIDNFKEFNDKYGHAIGDKILKLTAEILKSNSRQGGDIVARYGGDEFVLILTETTLSSTQILAKRIKAKIKEMVINDGNVKEIIRAETISVSIGIKSFDPGHPDRNLIVEADKEMYRAKEIKKAKKPPKKIAYI